MPSNECIYWFTWLHRKKKCVVRAPMAVFQMLGEGFSVQEITQRLNLSRKTVETYRRRVKEKLDFDTVAELLQYAVQWRYGQGEVPGEGQ